MIELKGDLAVYARVRDHVIRGLFEHLGGEVPTGPIAAVVRNELQPKTGDPDDRRFDNFIVDAYDRALACMTEIRVGGMLRIITCAYDEPRPGYLQQADPLAERLPHSALN